VERGFPRGKKEEAPGKQGGKKRKLKREKE
jgi:hypothetical protein